MIDLRHQTLIRRNLREGVQVWPRKEAGSLTSSSSSSHRSLLRWAEVDTEYAWYIFAYEGRPRVVAGEGECNTAISNSRCGFPINMYTLRSAISR